MIVDCNGDLFDPKYAPVDVYVNAVNCVGVMGKGIAAEFKRRWPRMFESYRDACSAGDVHPGQLHVWLERGLVIYNVPTKYDWRERSSDLSVVMSGISSLADCLSRIDSGLRVAVPALGCGEGGLAWDTVRPLLVSSLSSLDHEVLLFAPFTA